jgi:hypothetical protein
MVKTKINAAESSSPRVVKKSKKLKINLQPFVRRVPKPSSSVLRSKVAAYKLESASTLCFCLLCKRPFTHLNACKEHVYRMRDNGCEHHAMIPNTSRKLTPSELIETKHMTALMKNPMAPSKSMTREQFHDFFLHRIRAMGAEVDKSDSEFADIMVETMIHDLDLPRQDVWNVCERASSLQAKTIIQLLFAR